MSILCTQDEAEYIVEQFGDLVFAFALSLTRRKDVAEDVVQEVFLRYIRKKPVFQNEDHARAWFFTVTKNCCRNHFSCFFETHTIPLEKDIPMLQKPEYGLYAYVLQLPIKYRTVIHLYYYEELSTLEIAALLHKPDGTIRTQLKRARALLRQAMEGSGIDEIL